MPSRGRRSDPNIDSRSNRRRSKTTQSLASNGSAVNSALLSHPTTSVGRTSSTGLTSPSDTLPDFDPAPFCPDDSDPDFRHAVVSPPLDPGQDLYAPTGPDQGHYGQSSPEAVDYASPGSSNDTAASMVVFPGSPPSPPKMMGENPTYGFDACLSLVGAGYQAASPYPLRLRDADIYGLSDAVDTNHQVNQHCQQPQGEEEWDMCDDGMV
ncbi:hypothetical protein N657DRAFT_633121 [Parathielavia appendiculata]|uniref:Uncharacterized protein n=1 Tax=Parathielavia appendiculata TaxID=2587402 RepID=A0AAN6U2G3_9PEZI|nr:hypothetical protein N657DRAFT_633121 [Parathielavia appendiculata]